MKRRSILMTLLLAAIVLPGAVSAQIFTPSYLTPRQSSDLGIHISDAFGRGGGLAVEGLWRRGFGAYDLGIRGGVGEGAGNAYLLIGGDYRRPLALGTDPVSLALTGGAQAAIGEGSAFGLDVGVTLGSTFTPEGIAMTPYLHPRVALVTRGGDERSGISVLADLGVEVEVQPNFLIRLALGFGTETAAFGIGLAWR